MFLSLHPNNKTLAHLPLSVGNHPRVVLHQFELMRMNIQDIYQERELVLVVIKVALILLGIKLGLIFIGV